MALNSVGYASVLMEEICLEGLDGITLESLWVRLGARLKLKLIPAFRKKLWSMILQLKSVNFYLLPVPRRFIKTYNRYENIDDRGNFIPVSPLYFFSKSNIMIIIPFVRRSKPMLKFMNISRVKTIMDPVCIMTQEKTFPKKYTNIHMKMFGQSIYFIITNLFLSIEFHIMFHFKMARQIGYRRQYRTKMESYRSYFIIFNMPIIAVYSILHIGKSRTLKT